MASERSAGSVPNALLREMLLDVKLSPAEVDARFSQASDRAYWSGLCPSLAIDGEGTGVATHGATLAPPGVASRIIRDGWLKTEPFFTREAVGRVVAGLDALARGGWPAIFVFLFDEAWQMVRHAAVVDVVSEALGGELVQLPFVWCHQVAARRGAAGWLPHADKAEKNAGAITVWIPLTDATLDNGCMVMLPRDAVDAEVQERFLASAADAATLTSNEVMLLLQGAHAVPAAAGSVLAWDDSTIHWGGRCVEPGAARISLAISYARRPAEGAVVPAAWTGFAEARGPAPSFEARLRLVGHALRRYWSAEPLMSRWEPLATRLTAT